MLESALERKCGLLAKSHGCLFIKNIGIRGFPDRTIIGPTGRIVYIEFKRPDGGRLSKLQEYYIDQLRQRSIQVFVVDDYHSFEQVLKEYVL